MDDNQVTGIIIDAAMKVHSVLGAGLLESVYEVCLAYELKKRGLNVEQQKQLPVVYDEMVIDNGYRIDIYVNQKIVVELKAVEIILPIHEAQLLSYLKLSKNRIGLLLNFNVVHFRNGIKRMVL